MNTHFDHKLQKLVEYYAERQEALCLDDFIEDLEDFWFLREKNGKYFREKRLEHEVIRILLKYKWSDEYEEQDFHYDLDQALADLGQELYKEWYEYLCELIDIEKQGLLQRQNNELRAQVISDNLDRLGGYKG